MRVRRFLPLWVFFIFLLARGYSFGKVNQVSFIPAIYKLANPAFLNGDWYVNSLIHYHYLFNLFYAKLTQFMPLPALFLFSYCCALFLYIFSLKKISKILFREDSPFYILFVLLMTWYTGGIEINSLIHLNDFESQFLATPVIIFAIAYFFENKTTKSFILAGIATLIHLQMGINIFIILLLSYLILNFRSPSKMLRDIGIPVLCYLMISLWPAITVFKNLLATDVAWDNRFYIDYIKFRIPHHFILTFSKDSLLNFVLLCFLGFMGFVSKRKDNTEDIIINHLDEILNF
jgi:hypothetical protein